MGCQFPERGLAMASNIQAKANRKTFFTVLRCFHMERQMEVTSALWEQLITPDCWGFSVPEVSPKRQPVNLNQPGKCLVFPLPWEIVRNVADISM